MEFEKVIRERSSTRRFSDKPLEREKLDKILEAGRIAPTAKNLQDFKIYVIESPEAIEKLDSAHPCRYGAPTSLLVCADNTNSFDTDGVHTSGAIDASIVATHMMLEATNLGVDNIWTWAWGNQKLAEALSLPKEIEPICVLPLGYHSEEDHGSHLHDQRKDISELVEYI